jgi:hypothetical protein
MKNFKTFSFLIATIALLLIPEPSYGKETWLKCKELMRDGKVLSYDMHHIFLLNSKTKRFEIEKHGKVFQGNADYFKSIIGIKYSNILGHGDTRDNTPGIQEFSYSIDRATLNFTLQTTLKIAEGSSVVNYSGECKVIPPPSARVNQI